MGQFIDVSGLRFGRLVVLGQSETRAENGSVRWTCRCDCGKETIVNGDSLRRKNGTRSCGCFQLEHATKHGRYYTPEYRCWGQMLSRCSNLRHKGFPDYGGRGITVCERWHKFENFLSDMGLRPTPELSIDRINNDGNYEPGNCRWATAKQQQNNRRPQKRRRILHVKGKTFGTLAEAAQYFGVGASAVRHWINGQKNSPPRKDCYVTAVS